MVCGSLQRFWQRARGSVNAFSEGKGQKGQEQAVYEGLYGQGLRLAVVGTSKRRQQRWGTGSSRNGV